MHQWKSNIAALYLVKISKWFNMVMPVIVLFYQENGLSMQQIFTLKAIYSVAIVLMELPSGYLADVWGRRLTLLLGGVLAAAGFGLYSFANGFMAFALAEVVLGAGHSFFSGADSAMLYDTLKSAKKQDDYAKHEGWITSAGNFAEAFAGITGGFLATISLHTPLYFQFGMAALAIPACLAMKEPKQHALHEPASLKQSMQIVLQTLQKPTLRSALLLSAFAGTASLTFAWFVQLFFEEAGLPVSAFGWMWTLLNLTVALSSMASYRFRNYLGARTSLVIIISALTAGYLLAASSVTLFGIATLFFFYLFRGIAHPILKDHIHQNTDSNVRATVLSLRDFVIRINFAVVGPFLGWITDHHSLSMALIMAGLLFLLPTMIVLGPLWKSLEKK